MVSIYHVESAHIFSQGDIEPETWEGKKPSSSHTATAQPEADSTPVYHFFPTKSIVSVALSGALSPLFDQNRASLLPSTVSTFCCAAEWTKAQLYMWGSSFYMFSKQLW